MRIRTLVADGIALPEEVDQPTPPPDAGWIWCDVIAGRDDAAEVVDLADRFGLDRLAVRDAMVDVDLPKVDDFVNHLLIVLHGLRRDRVATYEVHCFVGQRTLVTIHDQDSRVVDLLWDQVRQQQELATVTVDELAALLADVLTRRLLGVLEAFDDRIEELTAKALRADRDLLEDLAAIRTDLAGVRRIVHPQREVLDELRRSTSSLVGDAGRRRFSDAFDVASRAGAGLDEARAALSETLDAYRGAEARQATEISRVLTIYAAIMLPLSLIAGFFGMNFVNLPWADRRWGWIAATGLMVAVAVISLGMFVSLGWMARPSGRKTGRALGRGLLEATRTPVQLMGAVVEMSTLPLRATGALLTGSEEEDDEAQRVDGDPLHGSE